MHSSLCAMPLWITPLSAREAFIFTWAIEVFKLCQPGMGSGSLSGALPACRTCQEMQDTFQSVPFQQKCLGKEIWAHWGIPAIGSSFPSLTHLTNATNKRQKINLDPHGHGINRNCIFPFEKGLFIFFSPLSTP